MQKKRQKRKERRGIEKEKMGDIAVTVIMPVYNSGEYLQKGLASLERQSLKNFECIVVDDGSDDNSAEILQDWKLRFHGRLRYYYQNNSGQSAARNFALQKAGGEYIAFLDSDDYLDESYLEMLYQTAKAADSDVVISGQFRVDPEGRLVSRICYPVRADGSCSLRRLNFSGKLYRRTYLEQHRLRFAQGKIYEDNPFNLVAFFLAKNVVVLPYEGYYQVVHTGSTTTRKIAEEKLPLAELEGAVRYLKENELQVNDWQLLEFTVLSFFTYFIFAANKRHYYLEVKNRKSDRQVVLRLCDFVKSLIEQFFPDYASNPHVGLFRERELGLKQCAGVWLFVRLLKWDKLKFFAKLFYAV